MERPYFLLLRKTVIEIENLFVYSEVAKILNGEKLDQKKEIERHHLTRFISNEQFKFLVYGIQDSETPDFIVNIDKKLISIEHTRLINPELKETEQYRERIIQNAKIKFRKKYKAELYVLMTFNNIQLKSGKIVEEKYTVEVFKLIEGIYLCNKNFDFRIESRDYKASVSKLISSFSVDNTRKFENWQHFGAYLVEYIDIKWLQSIITKNENNIKKYVKNFHENWLLLVADFGTKSSAHRFDNINFSEIKTTFDRVYIYNFIPDEVGQIK